ncbi:MAG: DUF3482 domain-containing protein [Gammaproteobacteria bacterium]|nr:DUF3482 domain-containing protein [Gammaproteobacteria bacterium]
MIVNLSLISHTNVGKTSLARTLLRRDIGEVRDEAHVTEEAEAHMLLTTREGDELALWDTPGFGDSARLLRRLRQSANPIGWVLSQVWDRFADRPFWSSQQAVRHVRDDSDLVLYVANISEDPQAAGYVDAELQILEWIGKPAIVLLNQLGLPRPQEAERAETAVWRNVLSGRPMVRGVLAFDAFARCWVQEDVLLAAIEPLLPPEKHAAFTRLRAAWSTRNLDVFARSMVLLARQLAAAATDRETLTGRHLAERARAWLSRAVTGVEAPAEPGLEQAMRALARRLDVVVRETTDELIALHGLAGRAKGEILAHPDGEYRVARPADTGRATMIGGLASGALSGLAADLAAGGLTFGAGALIGGVLGALGAGGLTHAYNLARGVGQTEVSWSAEFLCGRVAAALLRYLAVAHFGRGRGGFVAAGVPGHWLEAVEGCVTAERAALERIFRAAGTTAPQPAPDVAAVLQPIMHRLGVALLGRLYPGAVAPVDRDPQRGGNCPSNEPSSP